MHILSPAEGMINPHCLELPMSRINFNGPKDVRAIEVLRLSKGWSGVHLLHDNASSHKCEVVKSFLVSEKVKVLNHPPYSPYPSHCDFFLFPRLKKMLSGNKYTSRSSLGSAIYQCLQQIPKEDYLSAFRGWVKRLQKCVSVKGGIL